MNYEEAEEEKGGNKSYGKKGEDRGANGEADERS